MNTFPQPQYKKGDKVYAGCREYSDEKIQCPDCLGTLKWIVVFADGDTHEVQCQTCARGYLPPSGYINYKSWKPNVKLLTIGEIKYDDNKYKYMCEETGVGSGTLWSQEELFTSKAAAESLAKEKHEEGMKQLAQNNFSKKLKGSKEIENMLSTFGYTRYALLEKKRKFIMWAEISGLIKETKK